MRHGFTHTLASAIRHADDQARQLCQEFVGAEHLLLGILAAGKGQAVLALKKAGDVDAVRKALIKALPHAPEQPLVTGRLPLSPMAQQMINNALCKAQSAGQTNVSTRALLLALMQQPQSAVVRALSESGADLDELGRVLHDPAAAEEA